VTTRVTLRPAQRAGIERGEFVRVHLPVLPAMAAPFGRAASSVLVGSVAGELRAYWNACPHRLVPLDFGGLSPMSDDRKYLLCNQHGALFRPEDGVCIEGPCVGDALTAVGVAAGGEDDLLVEEVNGPTAPRE
jgi:nitrite reductase/ring-hydroxylating ferredoxin subunit